VVIAKVKGIEDRNAAEALKGTELFVSRAKLPPPEDGSFYYADLIGLAAELATGETLGRVSAMENFGGGDVMEITAPDGRSEFVPFTAVANVDLAAGKVTVNPVPGLFETKDTEEESERGGDAA
jgi:16S rRNA processing protein RimM